MGRKEHSRFGSMKRFWLVLFSVFVSTLPNGMGISKIGMNSLLSADVVEHSQATLTCSKGLCPVSDGICCEGAAACCPRGTLCTQDNPPKCHRISDSEQRSSQSSSISSSFALKLHDLQSVVAKLEEKAKHGKNPTDEELASLKHEMEVLESSSHHSSETKSGSNVDKEKSSSKTSLKSQKKDSHTDSSKSHREAKAANESKILRSFSDSSNGSSEADHHPHSSRSTSSHPSSRRSHPVEENIPEKNSDEIENDEFDLSHKHLSEDQEDHPTSSSTPRPQDSSSVENINFAEACSRCLHAASHSSSPPHDFDCSECHQHNGIILDEERLRRIAANHDVINALKLRIALIESSLRCAHPCHNPPPEAQEALIYLQQRLADLSTGEPNAVHLLKAKAYLKLKRLPSVISRILRSRSHSASHEVDSGSVTSTSATFPVTFSITASTDVSSTRSGVFQHPAQIEVDSKMALHKMSHQIATREANRVVTLLKRRADI